MKIDGDKCVSCLLCLPYCPVGAIKQERDEVRIDQDGCIECGVCIRSGVCSQGAIYQPDLEWPRVLRSQFSNPLVSHPLTQIMGRGTAEMKTNDVTGRFRAGEVGFAIEMGRPGLSTSFRDVETVTMALAGKVDFEPDNPITSLIDVETGMFRDETVLAERALSAIIECKTTEGEALEALNLIREVSEDFTTVFSLCVITRCQGFEIPFKDVMESNGFEPRINGKTNVGLGRPRA
ncbi:MAG: DUF362 domain-containing protein [Candidatus Bathyarchaeia archaeon]